MIFWLAYLYVHYLIILPMVCICTCIKLMNTSANRLMIILQSRTSHKPGYINNSSFKYATHIGLTANLTANVHI